MSHIDHLNIDLSPLQLENNQLTDDLRLARDHIRKLSDDLIHTRQELTEANKALDKFKQAERDRSQPATSIAIGSDGRHTRNGVQQ